MAPPPKWRKECHFFNLPGGCKRGEKCTFMHTRQSRSGVLKKEVSGDVSDEDQVRRELARWFQTHIPRDSELDETPPLGSQRARLFQGASELVAKSPEAMQTVIEKLASEGGLFRIRELVQRTSDLKTSPPENQLNCFLHEVVPFFQVLSHEKVVKSHIAERNYETIINYLFGTNGSRSLALFNFVSKSLVSLVDTTLSLPQTDPAWQSQIANVHSCLQVLAKIVDLNGSAQITGGFEPIIESLAISVARLSSFDDRNVLIHHSRLLVTRVGDRLNIGKALPILSHKLEQKLIKPQPVFRVQIDGPGTLAKQGPRHDNDFEDICQIRIMPTSGELRSDGQEEYLPVIDSTRLHLPGVAGLLDRQFRLTREDSVGPLRDAVRMAIRTGVPDRSHRKDYHAYADAFLHDMSFDKMKGLQLSFKFPQLVHLQQKSLAARRKWWELSGRLQQGGLVCLLDQRQNPIFCTVQDTGISKGPQQSKYAVENTDLKQNLFESQDSAFVTLTLVETDQKNVNLVLETLGGNQRMPWSLIEFPGVILASFMPTLQALQRRQKKGDLPFSDLLVSSAGVTQEKVVVEPPAYTLPRDFRFDLSCLTGGSKLFLSTNAGDTFDIATLRAKTSLDDAQADSLVSALTQKLALIQGPPGTGKSFTGVNIIKTLLANRDRGRIGPIIVVCYTNHALDQLLEHLLAQGVENIIRMGSRSKLEALEKLTLKQVSMDMLRTKHEKNHAWKYNKETAEHITTLQDLIRELGEVGSTTSVASYLARVSSEADNDHYYEIFQVNEIDEDGFKPVRYQKHDPLSTFLNGGRNNRREPRQLSQLLRASTTSMSLAERWMMFDHWNAQATNRIMTKFRRVVASYLESRKELQKVRQEIDLRCLQEAEIIGMTTTGLAQGLDLLECLDSKVILCEEAGEVLESHALATLLPNIEHAIFIGDHLQLRPQILNNDLSIENPLGKKYSLDVSLFERLVTPTEDNSVKLPLSTLSTQRRMHPSISSLIRPLYPALLDADIVEDYPGIPGMSQRLFWFNHEEPEAAQGVVDLTQAPTSHTNDFEVEMTTRLVSHLVKQGAYQPGEIAIITPYVGQLRRLRDKLSAVYEIVPGEGDDERLRAHGLDSATAADNDNENHVSQGTGPHQTTLLQALRVATVDSFQGEEAKVVIISLVRCNDQNRCGFLKTSNRINVLLSRAKHGMYIIGNARTCRSVGMWSDVIGELDRHGRFGNYLELCCPRHPEEIMHISTPDDFLVKAPEGGCSRRCRDRLPCGHACVTKCHSETLHEATRCLEKCQRQVNGCNEHQCPNVCGVKCPSSCTVQKHGIELPCGHSQSVPCYQADQLDKVFCTTRIKWKMDSCGHETTILCGHREMKDRIRCNEPCNTMLPCGHLCRKVCCRGVSSEPGVKTDHGTCETPCDRPLNSCSHRCTRQCHDGGDCGLCTQPCETKCAHSQCKKTCSEPCAPCAQDKCTSECPHSQCQMPCAVPCDRLPCSKRCTLLLACGHQCPSPCGEACPDIMYCQTCGCNEIKDRIVDMITMDTTYAEADLDDDPCLFPPCGHFLTMSTFDGLFAMSDYYEADRSGTYIAITPKKAPYSAKELKLCPECRKPLQMLSRYSHITKRALLQIATQRLLVWAQAQYVDLEDKFQNIETLLMTITEPLGRPLKLEGSREDHIKAISWLPMFSEKSRSGALQCYKDISKLSDRLREQEQPFQRVWMLEQNARRAKGLLSESSEHDRQEIRETVQMRHYIMTCVLSLRCELALLSAVLRTAASHKSSESTVDFSSQRAGCVRLIEMARKSERVTQQSEGHVLFAKFAALESCTLSNPEDASSLKEEGLQHISVAHELCKKHPGQTRGQLDEIEATERMLVESFYTTVTNEERRSILKAMSAEFRGTGHWYTCANGHPFSIGECGMPMEQASCPECGAAVGGQNHQPVEGTDRDTGMEDLMRDMVL